MKRLLALSLIPLLQGYGRAAAPADAGTGPAAQLRLATTGSEDPVPDGAPTAHGQAAGLTCRDLAGVLARQGDTAGPLGGIIDVSVISSGEEGVPTPRAQTQFGKEDPPFHQATLDAIRKGFIDEDTLVIPNTGHGLVVAAAMASVFGSDVYAHLPQDRFEDGPLTPPSLERLRSQAQSYALAIEAGRRAGRKGASTVLVVDLHTDKPFSQETLSRLPDIATLRKLGIKKIFIGTEVPPGKAGPQDYRPGSHIDHPSFIGPYEWLDRLAREQDGIPGERIPIIVDGLDTRHIAR